MEDKSLGFRFMAMISQLMKVMSFEVDILGEPMMHNVYHPDFYLKKNDLKIIAETKFYRSKVVSREVIITAANLLSAYDTYSKYQRLLIISSLTSDALKRELRETFGVVLWDRSNITAFMAAASAGDFLLHDFGQFILESQQGISIEDPYLGVDDNVSSLPEAYFVGLVRPINKGGESSAKAYKEAFSSIPTGVKGAYAFEEHCETIIEYMFTDDLPILKRQLRTDDNLSRFDLIGKIGSNDDFWNALVTAFSSRYILFEFKNYKEPLPQGQVYTTERYLYTNALRSCCIIVARNGVSKSAVAAAKGALRENGKLILFLSESDLIQMLDLRDNGGSPNDFLADRLDDFLMSISR